MTELVSESLNPLLQNAGGCCHIPGWQGLSWGSCPPVPAADALVSAGHLQRRCRQCLLELRRRTRSRMDNVPGEPKWMCGKRRRRAGFSDVSQPLQGHRLCPCYRPSGDGYRGPSIPFGNQAGKQSPAQSSVSLPLFCFMCHLLSGR